MSFLTQLSSRRLSQATTTSVRRAFSTTAPRDLARLSLIGRLGTTPELATTSTGKELLKYVIAVPTGRADSTGNRPTSWFRVSNFDVPNEGSKGRDYLLGLEKGTLVFVEGDASLSSFADAETGKSITALNVVSRRLEVLKRPFSQEDPTLVSE